MVHWRSGWPLRATLVLILISSPPVSAGFSVDEDPREVAIDPGDVFLPGLGPVCEVDDGDGSCPVPPTLRVPIPSDFDLNAFAVEEPVEVCPLEPPFPPGILFSLDDGEPGPQVGPPDHATELLFYDHCGLFGVRQSYHTTLTEQALGLGADPPPAGADDDVDAFETRDAIAAWFGGLPLIFSPDTPATGGLVAGNIYVSHVLGGPLVWATPGSLGVPDPTACNIDGIAPVRDPLQMQWVILFTTEASAPCGLDPGDIWVSNNAGMLWLYADDVIDMKIAASEADAVDVDALAINTGGPFEITDPFEPPEPEDPTFYKADWPNYAPSGMPDFEQDHAGWPPTWCGPTAVWNSLWWFDSEMECELDRPSGDNLESEPNDSCDFADRLGEAPPIPGTFVVAADRDWYVFDVPSRRHRLCTVTISTCALAQPGDADTILSLYGHCDAGTPGGLIATNDDGCLPSTQSEITAVLPGGRYWVRVDQGSAAVGGVAYNLSLGLDCYPMVEAAPDVADDHSEYNTTRFVPALASCMNTDDVFGTGAYRGTLLANMQACIDTWLSVHSLDRAYTEVTVLAPSFEQVEAEIERSEDVILLLGFYWPLGAQWVRCGGHYVTSAGVDSENLTITLSDPGLNNAEPFPVGTGGPGRVRGPAHTDHAPGLNPPPDHDDAQNVAHDRYRVGPPGPIVPPVSTWSLVGYGTPGGPTTCGDVARWCMMDYGQNPLDPSQPQFPCASDGLPVAVEVEAMVDVSPLQTPVCVYLDADAAWPANLRVRRGACQPEPVDDPYDVIRGKLCNLRFDVLAARVDLGHVECLYDDVALDEFLDVSPDDDRCFGSRFYLIRKGPDPDYGTSAPNGESRTPSSGGCP